MSLQPALLGGLFIGVLSALPVVGLANCCCIWIIGGGMLAAYLDQQGNPAPTTPMRGAIAGALAGAVGALVWVLTATMLDAVLIPIQQRLIAELLSSDLPGEARDLLEAIAARERSALTYFFGFAFMLVLGSAFSALGGVLGAIYFRNDVPPALGGPIQPPPLPPQ